MPVPKDPAHPDFPHGESRGYNYGCRATYPCPADTTCSQAHAAQLSAYRQRIKKNNEGNNRRFVGVRDRLHETLAALPLPVVAERTGLPVEQISGIADADLRTAPTQIPEEVAAPLDALWALQVHGIDVTAPRFEHGRVGFRNKCRCATCRNGARRRRLMSAAKIVQPGTVIYDPTFHDHVAALVAAGNANQIDALTGIDKSAIRKFLADPARGMRKRNYDKLRALTPDKVARARADRVLVDGARSYQVMRTLAALGYPRTWLLEQVGLTGRTPGANGREVYRSTERALEALARRIGDTPATPENTGYPAQAITLTASRARRAGFYPPAFYDDDGNLAVSALPDHPWTELEARAGDLIQAAKMCANGHTQGEAAQRLGVNIRTVQRWVKPLGFTYMPNGEFNLYASWEAKRRVDAVYADYEAHEIGPITAALALGLLDGRKISRPKATQDHPEVKAWNDRNTETTEAVA